MNASLCVMSSTFQIPDDCVCDSDPRNGKLTTNKVAHYVQASIAMFASNF
jgi:hypothetical protein